VAAFAWIWITDVTNLTLTFIEEESNECIINGCLQPVDDGQDYFPWGILWSNWSINKLPWVTLPGSTDEHNDVQLYINSRALVLFVRPWFVRYVRFISPDILPFVRVWQQNYGSRISNITEHHKVKERCQNTPDKYLHQYQCGASGMADVRDNYPYDESKIWVEILNNVWANYEKVTKWQ